VRPSPTLHRLLRIARGHLRRRPVPITIGAVVLISVVLVAIAQLAGPTPAGTDGTSGPVASNSLDEGTMAALEKLVGEGGNIVVIAPAQALSAVQTEPARTIASIALPLVLLGLLLVVIYRSRAGREQRDPSSGFRTILPGGAGAGEGGPPIDAASALDDRQVRLDDVAGCDEAKLELTEMIEFLRAPERFRKLGASIPRGVMLYGPPGTGKTMLARAVAAEADVPFHYASGSEFVEKYVGVGARRVRELFSNARKLGRGVIFIDEFDALGRARGGANSHEEREQTLNQLLVELDGFSTTDEIVVIGATNRLDILDSAVLRPGRFTRKIHVGLPDVVGRRAILQVHAAAKPLQAEVDLDALARRTYGFSGAQLADLLNESAIFAARRRAGSIAPDDLHAGWLKVAVGTSRRRSMDGRERSIIAAHEIGHAICGRVHGDKRRVEEISLFAHGDALGVTVSSQEDNDLPSESDLRARLVALMGGRAAEELLFQDVTGGAGDDFDKANRLATSMVTRWGMGRDPESTDGGTSGRGELGFLVATGGGSMPSGVQGATTRAIRAILDEAYETACRTLVEHITTLRRLAAYLVEHERVDGVTFDALFEGRIVVADALGEWRPETARPRAWDEVAASIDRRFRPIGPVPVAAAAATAIAATGQPEAAAPATPAAAASLPAGARAAADGPVTRSGPAAPTLGGTRLARRTLRAVSRDLARPGARLRRRVRGLALEYLERAEAWPQASPTGIDER
jgi:cell division protease FtsH